MHSDKAFALFLNMFTTQRAGFGVLCVVVFV